MSTEQPRGDGDSGEPSGQPAEVDRLSMRVVEYPDATDRCTVFPAGLPDHERTTHWLSADRDVFVSLELRR